MARFLFCLPRYHTNIVPWVRLLQEHGHTVAVHAVTRGATENYDLLEPKVFEASALSRRLSRLMAIKGANEPCAFPPAGAYWRTMSLEAPDVVIIRGVTRRFSRLALACAIAQRRQAVIYDQEDTVPPAWSSTSIRRSAFKALGIPHVTTRLPKGNQKIHSGAAIPLPFGCPFDASALSDRPSGVANSPPRILMVAKYRERKGHRILLSALAELVPRLDFTLTFCGGVDGAEDEACREMVKSWSATLGLSDRVSFRDNVAHRDMLSVYRDHDVFVLPSRNEPAAVSPIEAAWAGCCVLVSSDTGTRGYIPPGTDYEFDSSNPLDLARAIGNAIANQKRLNEARRHCCQHVGAVAGPELILERLEALLSKRTAKLQ